MSSEEIYLFHDDVTGESRRMNVVQKTLWIDRTRNRVIVLHRRAGKTNYCCARMLIAILENIYHLYWYVAPTYTQAKSIAWGILMRMIEQFPEGTFKYNKQELSITCLASKSKLVLKGSDKPDSLRGAGLHGATLDESQDQDLKYLIDTVLRPMLTTTKGWLDIIGTPKGKNTFYDYHLRGIEGMKDWSTHIAKASETGIISAEELESIKAECSEESYNQEYECDFLSYAGLIYRTFGQHNYVEPFAIPDEWEWGFALDHGATNPTAVGAYRIDPEGNIFRVGEYYEPNKLISENVPPVIDLMPTPDHEVVCDPSIFAKNQQSKDRDYVYSLSDEYEENGLINLVRGNNDVGAGINRCNEYFKFNPNRIHPLTGERGAPKFFVFKGCNPKFDWEIANYNWRKKSNFNMNEPDQPLKVNDHAMDEVRYFVMSRPESAEIKKPVQMETPGIKLGRVQEQMKQLEFTGSHVPRDMIDALRDPDDPIQEALDNLNFS